jgi:hypothetical protein
LLKLWIIFNFFLEKKRKRKGKEESKKKEMKKKFNLLKKGTRKHKYKKKTITT